VGTEANAGPALDADDRPAVTLIKVDNPDNTFLGTVAAPGTFFAAKFYTAPRAGKQRFRRAGRGTRRFQATAADISSKLRLQSASGSDLDRAVTRAEAFVDHAGTRQHTRIATNTTVHPFSLQNFT